MNIRAVMFAVAVLLAPASARAADDFPSKTITIVNLYAAGGGIDVDDRDGL